MENVPMLTENGLAEIFVPIAVLLFIAGLVLWVIAGQNKRLAEEAMEPMTEADIKSAFDPTKLKSISVEHSRETKEDIDIKIALLNISLSHAIAVDNQESVDALSAKINKLIMERGARVSLEDIAMTGDSQDPAYGETIYFTNLEFKTPSKNDVSQLEARRNREEPTLDKIDRLHRETDECILSENYERCAEIKKELDKLYETKKD